MKLYIARHGITDWNQAHRIQGRKDPPLNATGRAQAMTLRNQLSVIDFTAVYASPPKRATETAQIATADRYEIIYDDRLMERSFGDFEGQILTSWSKLIGEIDIDDPTITKIPGNVEPMKNMLARAHDFINFLRSHYDEEAVILIVGHGAMFKAFDWLLRGQKAGEICGNVYLDNAEFRVYDLKKTLCRA